MNKANISRVLVLLAQVAASAKQPRPITSGKELLDRHAYRSVLAMAAVAGKASRAIVIVPSANGYLAFLRADNQLIIGQELQACKEPPMIFPSTAVSYSSDGKTGHQLQLADMSSEAGFFFAAAPIYDYDGNPCGMICITDPHARSDSSSLLDLLSLCGMQASQILLASARLDDERAAHARVQNQLEQRDRQLEQKQLEIVSLRHQVSSLELLSDTDGLTGIKNRRAFDAAINDELEYAARRPHPVSMLMIDVDNFKQYNDTYGHAKGDDVLKTIALVMQCCLRSFEHVARYGGEEFAMILPNSTTTEAHHVARRLQQAVEKHPWPDRPITISIGLATTSSRKTDTPASLISCADAALYNAKANGRNRVECYA